MDRPNGFHPEAFQHYIAACAQAEIDPDRVMQTVGNAPASAGFHAADGSFKNEDGDDEDYCAATDIRVRDLEREQIERLLVCLAEHSICAWWRHEGSFSNNVHCHFVYVAVAMKDELKAQVDDWMEKRTALVGHRIDDEWIHLADQLTVAQIEHLAANYHAANG